MNNIMISLSLTNFVIFFANIGTIASVNWNSSNTKMSGGDINFITFEEVKGLKDNDSVLLIDVREPNELKETGVIPGSINIPLKDVETVLKDKPAEEFQLKYNRTKPALDTPLVFYCKAGKRGETALNTALQLGYKNVRNYKGGYMDWEQHTKNN